MGILSGPDKIDTSLDFIAENKWFLVQMDADVSRSTELSNSINSQDFIQKIADSEDLIFFSEQPSSGGRITFSISADPSSGDAVSLLKKVISWGESQKLELLTTTSETRKDKEINELLLKLTKSRNYAASFKAPSGSSAGTVSGILAKRWFQLAAVLVLIIGVVVIPRVWDPGSENKSSENIVAEVDGKQITAYEFQVAINRRLLRILNVNNRLSSAQKEGIMLSVFKQLLNDKILEITAKQEGIQVTAEDIGARRIVLIDRLNKQAEYERQKKEYELRSTGQDLSDEDIQTLVNVIPTGDDLYNTFWSNLGFKHEMEFLQYLQYEIYEEKLAQHLFPEESFIVTDDDIISYIPRVEIRQIFFHYLEPGVTEKDPRQNLEIASERQWRLAMSVYEKVKNGADFSEMARQYSQETYASSGGYIGWVSPRAVVKEYWDKASQLHPGDITEPFVTEYGIHILKCLDRRETNDEIFSRFSGVIKQSILKRQQQTSFVKWFRQRFVDLEDAGKIILYHPVLLANKLRNTGHFPEAIESYRKAIQEDEEGAPYYHIDIAWILARQQKYEEALHELRIATEKAPTDPYTFLLLGEGYMEVGQLEKALSEFQKASDLTKMDYELHKKLMQIYSQLGLIEEMEREQQRMNHAIDLLGGAQSGAMGPGGMFKEPKFEWPETPSVNERLTPDSPLPPDIE